MKLKRMAAAALAATALGVGTLAAEPVPAQAASPTYCKTLYLSGNWAGVTINPHMSVPICYNGSSVWQSGGVTPGVSTAGYSVDGFSWYGTYGGGGWLGAGENFNATVWTGVITISCAPRWGINAWGNVTSYNRNC